MGTVVAVQHADLDGLINLAESSAEARLDGLLGGVARRLGVGRASSEATLHQGADRRLVGAVVQTIALSNLNAFLRRLVIGHRR